MEKMQTFGFRLRRILIHKVFFVIMYFIERIDATKFLGIILDRKLGFKGHVDTLSKKLSCAIVAIKKVRFFLPYFVLEFLYFFSCLFMFVFLLFYSHSNNNFPKHVAANLRIHIFIQCFLQTS